METGKEGAEEVMQSDDKGVPPLFAVVELECRVLLWALSERERCVCVGGRGGRSHNVLYWVHLCYEILCVLT